MRLIVLERIARPVPRVGEILGAMRGHHWANAVVSFLFAATGPVALILTVGFAGGLTPQAIASWITVAFGLGGVLTVVLSLLYRQPLATAWTISGTAIAGAAMLKFPYAEIVGAYVVTGAAMLVLGLSGGFKKLMDWMPQPIVMAMVAGLFLKFGLLAIDGFDKAPRIAGAAVAGFLLFSLIPALGRVIPPVVAALAAGAAAIYHFGGFAPKAESVAWFADPVFFTPVFSKAALLDLVLPLAISVLVLQNAQGIAILRMNHHNPPPNTITAVCGVGSVAFGLYGAVCTCLTGPANAIICTSGKPRDQYIGALLWGAFAIVFGLFAPGITELARAVPDSFIYVIGGLAMLKVLQQSFAVAFAGRFTAGAVVCFVVTVTELIPEARFTLLGIGAPFWGLLFGIAASLLLEPGDFRKPKAAVAAAGDQPELVLVSWAPPIDDEAPASETAAAIAAAAKAAAAEAYAPSRKVAPPAPPEDKAAAKMEPPRAEAAAAGAPEARDPPERDGEKDKAPDAPTPAETGKPGDAGEPAAAADSAPDAKSAQDADKKA